MIRTTVRSLRRLLLSETADDRVAPPKIIDLLQRFAERFGLDFDPVFSWGDPVNTPAFPAVTWADVSMLADEQGVALFPVLYWQPKEHRLLLSIEALTTALAGWDDEMMTLVRDTLRERFNRKALVIITPADVNALIADPALPSSTPGISEDD